MKKYILLMAAVVYPSMFAAAINDTSDNDPVLRQACDAIRYAYSNYAAATTDLHDQLTQIRFIKKKRKTERDKLKTTGDTATLGKQVQKRVDSLNVMTTTSGLPTTSVYNVRSQEEFNPRQTSLDAIECVVRTKNPSEILSEYMMKLFKICGNRPFDFASPSTIPEYVAQLPRINQITTHSKNAVFQIYASVMWYALKKASHEEISKFKGEMLNSIVPLTSRENNETEAKQCDDLLSQGLPPNVNSKYIPLTKDEKTCLIIKLFAKLNDSQTPLFQDVDSFIHSMYVKPDGFNKLNLNSLKQAAINLHNTKIYNKVMLDKIRIMFKGLNTDTDTNVVGMYDTGEIPQEYNKFRTHMDRYRYLFLLHQLTANHNDLNKKKIEKIKNKIKKLKEEILILYALDYNRNERIIDLDHEEIFNFTGFESARYVKNEEDALLKELESLQVTNDAEAKVQEEQTVTPAQSVDTTKDTYIFAIGNAVDTVQHIFSKKCNTLKWQSSDIQTLFKSIFIKDTSLWDCKVKNSGGSHMTFSYNDASGNSRTIFATARHEKDNTLGKRSIMGVRKMLLKLFGSKYLSAITGISVEELKAQYLESVIRGK